MGKQKKIGLVLHDSIGYSETFFFKELEIHKQLGFSTIVFTNATTRISRYDHVVGLPKKNINFYILCRAFYFLLIGLRPVFRLYQLEKKSGSSFKTRLKIIYLNLHILKEKVDCLYFGFGTCSLGKELLAKAKGINMYISFRGADLTIFPLGKKDIYERALIHADKIHVVSMDLQEVLSELLFKYNSNAKVHVIHPAVSTHAIIPKKDAGVLGMPIHLLTIGRLHWKKGYQYLLPAMKKMQDEGISIRCTIIGDGEMKTQLLYMIKSLKIDDSVALLGQLNHTEVIEQLKRADVYIQPSIQEGFGNALLEAQASGLLVIACDAEGIRENIEDGKSGWIIERMSIDAIVDGIKRILNLPEREKKDIATYAVERIHRQFELTNRVEEWEHFFSEA